MVMREPEDPLTRINTALNRSMVLMEDSARNSPKPKDKRSRKSITINTAAVKATSTPLQDQNTIRKSILKRTERERIDETLPSADVSISNGWHENNEVNSSIKVVERPHNLEEFMNKEGVILNPKEQTYTLQDVDPDDELWVMHVPNEMDPRELEGIKLHLGGKTKMKIGQVKYEANCQDTSDCLTCVFGTGKEAKPFKIVNIRPSGKITVKKRETLSAGASQGDDWEEIGIPSVPRVTKPRNPIVGVVKNGKIKKKSKSRLKKLQSLE